MRWALFLLGLLLFTASADARVVAILFDDSGSMGGRIQLPTFGAQLLVSTLDGREGEDRLIAARMSQVASANPVQFIGIKTTRQQQQAIDEIAARWPVANGGTPYQQIELLLDAVKKIQQPDEQAFFVVLTDGLFNDNATAVSNPAPPPPAAEMAKLFEQYKSELKGPLRADFVLIGANDSDVRTGVEQQGIRAALLSTFNGTPDDGRYEVYNSADLIEAIKTIIAQVAATDRKGQSHFLKVTGNAITLDSPLSIKRIVAVAVGSQRSPPARAEQPAFPVADRIDLISRMRGADTKGGWAGEQLSGVSTHLLLQPALPAGHYEVPFDRAPNDVFLLFQTDAGLNLVLTDANGSVLMPTAGAYRIRRGQKVMVGFEVVDKAGNKIVSVPVSKLGGHATFKASVSLAGKRNSLDVSVDRQSDQAFAVLPTDQIGRGEVNASLRIEGFVSTYAKPLAIEVIDASATVGLDVNRIDDCPTCAADEVRYIVAPNQPQRPIANVTVKVTAPMNGALKIMLSHAPPWLSLTDASGAPLRSELPVTANVPLEIQALVLASDGAAALQAPPSDWVFTVRAELSGGPEGSNEVTRRMQLLPVEASLVVTGHTQDPTGATPLELNLKSLEGHEEALDFLLTDALTPVTAGRIDVKSDAHFVTFAPITGHGQVGRIAVQPRAVVFCSCLVFLDRGEHRISVTWTGPNGLQTASVEETVLVDPAWSEIGWACAKTALVILLLLYVLRSLWAWFRARRFPARSGVSVYFGRQEEPLYRQLRRWDWTPLKALLWPFFGNPDEVRVVEGLTLRAARNGANIVLERSDSVFRIETLNQTIEEFRAEAPTISTYKMNWNDSVERRDGGLRRLTLLRRPEDSLAR